MKKNHGLSGDQRSVYFIVSGPTDKTSKILHCDSGKKYSGKIFPVNSVFFA
jgi:hypothetical protein